MQPALETRFPHLTTPPRAALIADTVTGITGRGYALGYRPHITVSGKTNGGAFDDEVGALDAPELLPAGASRQMDGPGSTRHSIGMATWRG